MKKRKERIEVVSAKWEKQRNEQTSLKLGRIASRVLRDKRYSADVRALAGSVLTQLPDKVKRKLKAEKP